MHSKTDSRTRSNYTQKNKTEISKKWDKNESEKQPKRKKKTKQVKKTTQKRKTGWE